MRTPARTRLPVQTRAVRPHHSLRDDPDKEGPHGDRRSDGQVTAPLLDVWKRRERSDEPPDPHRGELARDDPLLVERQQADQRLVASVQRADDPHDRGQAIELDNEPLSSEVRPTQEEPQDREEQEHRASQAHHHSPLDRIEDAESEDDDQERHQPGRDRALAHWSRASCGDSRLSTSATAPVTVGPIASNASIATGSA